MVEPLTAAALGGLALDKAQAEIAKWVGAQIKARVELALRNKALEQGLPAKDQQVELSAVLTCAVVLTSRDLFPGQERLQKNFSKTLLKGKPMQRPLVNGSDLVYITDDVYEWITKHDPQPGARPDEDGRSAHPYLAILCRNIITQYGFRAENNGAKNSILHPRWHRFWTTELFTTTFAQPQKSDRGIHESPSWPRRLGPVPEPATARLERPVDQELTEAFAGGGTAVVCQVLSGMGGIGKTQIAAHYAHQRWNDRDVDLLLWVNAATHESITTAYAHAGTTFCNADPADSGQAAQAFLNWLDQPDVPRWLIILDDLTNPNDLSGMWPPSSTNGRTIVTTRRRDAALETSTRQRIDVDLYTPEQALRYLTDRLTRPELLTEVAELAADLGHLPLALAQAAVYILDQPGTTCATYRALLADRTLTLDHLSTDVLPDDYPRTVAAALQLSIEHADQYEPFGLASELLAIASLLDPAGIPADLFTAFNIAPEPGKHAKGQQAGGVPGRPTARSRAITDTLARLHRLNLIDYNGITTRIHALIQRVCRDRLDQNQISDYARTAATALEHIWPETENDPVFSASLRTNAAFLRDHAQPALLHDGTHPVLFLQGQSLGENGLVDGARHHFEELQRLCNDALGPDHPDTLASRQNCAVWQMAAGDVIGAASYIEALLNDCIQALGSDHPLSLACRYNLAQSWGDSGRFDEAISAFLTLQADYTRLMGVDHPQTLKTRGNIIEYRQKLGSSSLIQASVADCEALLQDLERVLGPDDPSTLTTRGNVARAKGRSGDMGAAVKGLKTVLADQQRVLGARHPQTLSTRNNLAHWKSLRGNKPGALKEYKALLETELEVLGEDHPSTLATRLNLANLQGELGDVNQAITDCKTLVEISGNILGRDHPSTLLARASLARWKGQKRDVNGAIDDYQALLVDQVRVLGPGHPRTLTTRHNLAHWRGVAGNVDQAIVEYKSLLVDKRRILGPLHPDTIAAEHNLSQLQVQAALRNTSGD